MAAKDEAGRGISARADFAWALFCGALVLLFFAPLLWRDPHLFWNDDYQLSILPVFAEVARSWSEGQLPLLSPSSWVCGNLAGEFQYGTFSVFVNAAVVVIWQFPLTFAQQAAALSLAHLFVLAMGGYLLGRGRDFSPPLALMIGFIAALNGWIVCWGAIDWFGALGAFAWLPWAWWGSERALDSRRGRSRFLWPAPFVYLLIAGGFPYTVIMLVLLAGWLAVQTVVERRSLAAVWPLVVGMALGVGLSAPAWLALVDSLHGSVRQAQESSAHWQWLVPPAALPAFILPAWTVNWADFSTRLNPHTATELACGIVAPVALLWGIMTQRGALVGRMRWDLALLVVVLIASMLPTANVFRWSFRWLPFLHVILAVCAAEALRSATTSRRGFGLAAVVLVALTGAAMWVAGAAGPFGWRLLPWLLAVAVWWACLEAWPGRFALVRRWSPAALTFVSLLVTYFAVNPVRGVPRYHLDQNLTEPAPLDPQRLYVSVHPAPEGAYRMEEQPEPMGTVVRPGSTSMWAGVRFVNGYSPIRPAGVAREFAFLIHGEIPEWMSDYLLHWQAGPEGELARIGVDGIVVDAGMELAPQPEEEWTLAFQNAEGRVYHRVGSPFATVRPVPWLEAELLNPMAPAGAMKLHPRDETAREFAAADVRVLEDSRHRVVAEVAVPAGQRPALLAFSRPFFRGYRASLDGQPLAVTSYRSLLPMVELPAGARGQLSLVFRPWWLMAGGAIAGTTVLLCLLAGYAAWRERPLRPRG
ncbi:hypothetical protein BH20VER2_BH20VER2_00080 [soil metagenome]